MTEQTDQLTRTDLAKLTAEEIEAARQDGRLDRVLGIEAARTSGRINYSKEN
jgi:hypothetical protein